MGSIIDLTAFFPWRILMLFAYSFAYFNIAHALLKDKYYPIVTFAAIFATRLCLSLVASFFSDNEELKLLDLLFLFLFLVITFILLLFLTEGTIIKKFLATIFYLISHVFTSFASALYCNALFHGEDFYALYNVSFPQQDFLQVFFANLVLVLSISFLFAGILKLFNTREAKYTHKKLYAYFSFLPISHILFFLVVLFSMPIDTTTEYSNFTQILLICTLSLILIFDCSFPFVVDHFEKIEIQNARRKDELIKAQLNYHQTQILKEEQQQFRKIKHDFINLTTTAKGFIEIGKPEKALSILSKTNNDLITSSGFYICSNDTINTILYIKQKQAKEVNVNLSVDIDETALLLIDDYSICRIIHNLMDNAIEAASKAEDKVVNIAIKIDDQNFEITCSNAFIKNQGTQSRKEGHGYGLQIVKEVSNNYNGNYTLETVHNIFYSNVKMQNVKLDKK